MQIHFTRPLCHGYDRIHALTSPLRRRSPCSHGLKLGMYNIQYGQGFGLPQALKAVQLGKYDLVLLTETKTLDSVHCKIFRRYDIVCSMAATTASGGAQGDMGLLYMENTEGWYIESTYFRGPNLMNCGIVSGLKQTPLIRYYPPRLL